MIFETRDAAETELTARYALFAGRVKEKDQDAHVSLTRVFVNDYELIVTNSKGGKDSYSFSITPCNGGFEIQGSRVIQ
ncbi:hypothetical protein UGMREWDR_CDS0015 [Aeromonas phage GomatiRiver_11]|nr:hypothetical protein OBDJBBDK_00015 [Aeromonas phage AhFM11]WKW84182.1 hypothetical protein UGMREWDR_CDS0015 [Aeromonas phage GomatiRiver_11]